MFEDLKQKLGAVVVNSEARKGISRLAEAHTAKVHGAFDQYFQYTQNSGDVGGPAGPGDAFWQNVFRQYTLDPGSNPNQ